MTSGEPARARHGPWQRIEEPPVSLTAAQETKTSTFHSTYMSWRPRAVSHAVRSRGFPSPSHAQRATAAAHALLSASAQTAPKQPSLLRLQPITDGLLVLTDRPAS
jgi:hypothetical protein